VNTVPAVVKSVSTEVITNVAADEKLILKERTLSAPESSSLMSDYVPGDRSSPLPSEPRASPTPSSVSGSSDVKPVSRIPRLVTPPGSPQLRTKSDEISKASPSSSPIPRTSPTPSTSRPLFQRSDTYTKDMPSPSSRFHGSLETLPEELKKSKSCAAVCPAQTEREKYGLE